MTNEELFRTLEDYEIAFLIRYRLSEFLPLTRQTLFQEAGRRGLSETKIEGLVQKKLMIPSNQKNNANQCPRCTSVNLHSWVESYSVSSQLEGIIGEYEEIEINNKACFICGYKIERTKHSRLYKLILFIKGLFNQ